MKIKANQFHVLATFFNVYGTQEQLTQMINGGAFSKRDAIQAVEMLQDLHYSIDWYEGLNQGPTSPYKHDLPLNDYTYLTRLEYSYFENDGVGNFQGVVTLSDGKKVNFAFDMEGEVGGYDDTDLSYQQKLELDDLMLTLA